MLLESNYCCNYYFYDRTSEISCTSVFLEERAGSNKLRAIYRGSVRGYKLISNACVFVVISIERVSLA